MTNHLEGGANLTCFNHQSNRLSPGWHSVSCCCAKKIWDFCEFEPKFCIQWIGAGCNLQRGNQWENLLVEAFQPADHLWIEGSLPFDSIFAANQFKFFPRKSVPACNKITPTKLQRFVRLKDARFIFSVTVLEDSLESNLFPVSPSASFLTSASCLVLVRLDYLYFINCQQRCLVRPRLGILSCSGPLVQSNSRSSVNWLASLCPVEPSTIIQSWQLAEGNLDEPCHRAPHLHSAFSSLLKLNQKIYSYSNLTI